VPTLLRSARVDDDGFPYCRTCGSAALLVKSTERHKRIQHLKCEQCGERQRYRQRRLAVQGIDPDAASPEAAP
jgi:hypothetical protein